MSTQQDPAASYRRYTPRQAAQAAARHDREARETIAAYKAKVHAEARQQAVARELLRIERLGVCLITGTVAPSNRPLTSEDRKVCAESVKDAWKYLKRVGPDFVTVLS